MSPPVRASIMDVYRMSRQIAQIAAHSSRFKVSKMISALHEIDHVGGRMNRQRMLGKAGPWGDIACHFASQFELVFGCYRKQRNHQVFQRDDTDTQRHEFGIGSFWDWNSLVVGRRNRSRTIRPGASFIVPSGQSALTLVPSL